MPVRRKVFRIEECASAQPRATLSAGEVEGAMRHHEFMTEIKALRALIEPQARASVNRETLQEARGQIAEAHAYQCELDVIHAAIQRTRQETGEANASVDGSQIARVTGELRAVIAGTEQATQAILKAAEDIDQIVKVLTPALKSQHEQDLVHDIQDRVMQIFESCNFQDITGQRVAKVGATLKFVEDHVAHLMEIWSKMERFEPVVLNEARASDSRLLNGPQLDGDVGHSSQHEVDTIFASRAI